MIVSVLSPLGLTPVLGEILDTESEIVYLATASSTGTRPLTSVSIGTQVPATLEARVH